MPSASSRSERATATQSRTVARVTAARQIPFAAAAALPTSPLVSRKRLAHQRAAGREAGRREVAPLL